MNLGLYHFFKNTDFTDLNNSVLEKNSEDTCAQQEEKESKKKKYYGSQAGNKNTKFLLDFMMFAELSNFLKLKICYELFSNIN